MESLVSSMPESDRSFLLNAFGMTVTAKGDTMTFHETAGLTGEDGKAASSLAMQLMADRQRGAIEGDVSPDYFHALLFRAGDDSGQALQDMTGSGANQRVAARPAVQRCVRRSGTETNGAALIKKDWAAA